MKGPGVAWIVAGNVNAWLTAVSNRYAVMLIAVRSVHSPSEMGAT